MRKRSAHTTCRAKSIGRLGVGDMSELNVACIAARTEGWDRDWTWVGPVEKLEGWVGQWDTANGAVVLGILLQFGLSCQCLFGRSGGAKNDTPGALPTAVTFIENMD